MSVGIESGFSSEEVLNARFPMHRACRDGDVRALLSLLQCSTNRAELSVEDSFYGWTPLHWAAHFGTLDCVVMLVQAGCGVNLATSRFAQTPAHIAAFGGHPQCLLWLLQAGADLNRQDYVGESPIHKAARAGSTECVNILLLQGAKAELQQIMIKYFNAQAWTSLRNASGLTAADLAHAQGFGECAQLLSNAQNQQLSRLNAPAIIEPLPNGGPRISQARGFLNGAPSRKRSLDCMEASHFKKARTGDLDVQMNMLNGVNGSGGEDLMETTHMEFGPALSSTGSTLNVPHHLSEHQVVMGELTPGTENGNTAFLKADWKAGITLHLGKNNNGLHFGHHNGFGDTAESIEDASSQIEHQKSIRLEEHYDHAFFSTMHLFHGS